MTPPAPCRKNGPCPSPISVDKSTHRSGCRHSGRNPWEGIHSQPLRFIIRCTFFRFTPMPLPSEHHVMRLYPYRDSAESVIIASHLPVNRHQPPPSRLILNTDHGTSSHRAIFRRLTALPSLAHQDLIRGRVLFLGVLH